MYFHYKKNHSKNKRYIILRNMRSFAYTVGMTEEEITEKVKGMITYMNTDEYWLERGGNGLYWDEGGELMKEYLRIMDERGGTKCHKIGR